MNYCTFLFLGLSRKFVFQALPSANISLGDKLEIRCTANDTSDLSSVEIWSRMGKNLNVTCSVRSTSGFCILLINKVQLWDIGIYDCIKKFKNGRCFSKALTIQKAIQIPIENSTVATTSTLSTTNTTRKPLKSTTNSLKPQETTPETREEATSEIIKNVTNNEGSLLYLLLSYPNYCAVYSFV